MCLIVFAWKMHSKYKLIMLANRDEFYDRPSQRAHFWDNRPWVLAGKDLKANGTWCGINKMGKIAAVTNYRNPKLYRKNAYSRGNLVINYLNSKGSPYDYINKLRVSCKEYNGFNLLVGNTNTMYYFSNIKQSFSKLTNGIYGLSNYLLDTPCYKVRCLKNKLYQCVSNDQMEDKILFEIMKDSTPAPDDALSNTDINEKNERLLSSAFVVTTNYGTVNTTIIKVTYDGKVNFAERWYNPKDSDLTDGYFSFFM